VNAVLIAALVTGVVTAVGWGVNHILSSRADRQRQLRAAELSYVERQLAELYGPLLFLTLEGEAALRDLLQTLGRPWVFDFKGIPDDELNTWLFWVEHEFLPRNEAIQQLLASKSHLIQDADMPESFRAFVSYYNSWRVSHLRWQKEKVPYAWHAKENYPQEFSDDILQTFGSLKRRHSELIGVVTRGERLRQSGSEPPSIGSVHT
jgi:hypothetical protein